MSTITGKMLSDANFDVDVINTHKPRYSDVEIRRNDNGTRNIIIKNLPFNFTDELGGSLTEDEAQAIRREMISGNKTYREMCQVMARFDERKYGPATEERY